MKIIFPTIDFLSIMWYYNNTVERYITKNNFTKTKEKEIMCPEIKFAVNEDKREVIAYTKGTAYDAIRYVERKLPMGVEFYGMFMKGLMPDEFRSTVVCHPDDTFNVSEGMKIARKRLLDKYWRSRHKAVHRIKKEINYQMAMVAAVIEPLK